MGGVPLETPHLITANSTRQDPEARHAAPYLALAAAQYGRQRPQQATPRNAQDCALTLACTS